jgi:hypothetical protein
MSVAERLVNRLALISTRKTSRRSLLAAATLTGAALAVDPWGYLTRPQSAYASVCGPGASCGAGWSAMCCSINKGHNTCPPGSYPGGWWKADRSSFCGGHARYYIDCNAKPGHHFTCHCNKSNCDHRYVACNIFRYGQCNTQIHGVTAVVCRQISCRPPWQLYPGHCGRSSATDNNTARHNAPCLTKANTYPRLVTFAAATNHLNPGASLRPGQRLASLNRHTEAVFGTDGNFVIRNQDGVVWSTRTAGLARGGLLTMQRNGDLAIRDAAGTVRWYSHTVKTVTSAFLVLHDSGRLSIVSGRPGVPAGQTELWHTNTHTP